MQSQKRQNDLCSFPRQTIQYQGNPSYAPTSNAEKAEVEQFFGAEANRVLPRECTGDSKHPLPTTQEKTLHMNITIWLTPKSD